MRDNAGCNGNIANRLEDLGVEVVVGPFLRMDILFDIQVHTRQPMEK